MVHLENFKIAGLFFITSGFLMLALYSHAQDVHYAQVQEIKIWYNPALKINKDPLVHASIRSVKYQGITSYTSKAATVELPMFATKKEDPDNLPYMHLSIGMNADNSNDRSMNVSVAMMSLSYALPLNDDNTYLSLGFQGAYTFSRIGYNGYTVFPDKFDQYGPIAAAISGDPSQTGYTNQYFTAGAGVAFFHSGEKRQWYMGGSLRHFNKPVIDPTQSTPTRLAMNYGIQVGYQTAITPENVMGGYGNFIWQNGRYEHVIGALYTRNMGDSAHTSLSLGLGYRVGDALIPNIGFRTGASRFAFYYEYNISFSKFAHYGRKAFEFSYTLNF